MTQPRCKTCGKFIVSEFIESPYCDPCLDIAFAKFYAGIDEQMEVV